MKNLAVIVASLFVVTALTLAARVTGVLGSSDKEAREYADATLEVSQTLVSETIVTSIQDNRIERKFSVKPGGLLVIDTDRGSINVESGSSNELRVVIDREVTRGNEAEALQSMKFNFDQDGNAIRLTGEHVGGARKHDRNRLRVKIHVHTPENYNVDLKTAGGSISVADIEGEVKAKTAGGSLHFGDIAGPVYGRTSGGSVELLGSTGKADLKTSGGSIRIGHVDAEVDAHTSGGSISIEHASGYVNAETSGGSISVREVKGAINARTSGGSVSAYISEQPTADCRLSTSGGRVNVELAPNVALTLEARASGGVVRTDVPIQVEGPRRRDSVDGRINGGGPLLKVSATGGGVRISTLNQAKN